MNLRFLSPAPQPAHIGNGREAWEVWAAGPSSYSQATGDPVYGPATGEYPSAIASALSVSGNYQVLFQPGASNTLRPGFIARWLFSALGGTQVVGSVTGTGGSGMTAGTYALSFSGGGGSGAAGTITVTSSAITSITITNPGSGYTSAPTVSAATGGTPPTLTAHLGAAGGEVGAGTNLSGETVQTLATGGQY